MALNTSTIQSVFFDLDNTLIDHNAAEEVAFVQTYERFHMSQGEHSLEQLLEYYKMLNEKLWTAYRRREITTDQVRMGRWQGVIAEQFTGTNSISTLSTEEVSTFYLEAYDDSSIVIDGAEEIIIRTRERFGFVGIITNGFPSQVERKLLNHGWTQRFDVVVVSEHVGIAKPNQEIFDYALAQRSHAQEHSVYVGDNYEVDIVGAKNASWQTVWYCPTVVQREDTSHADLTIERLDDLLTHF